MLLQFSIKNFKLFKEKATLSLIASKSLYIHTVAGLLVHKQMFTGGTVKIPLSSGSYIVAVGDSI